MFPSQCDFQFLSVCIGPLWSRSQMLDAKKCRPDSTFYISKYINPAALGRSGEYREVQLTQINVSMNAFPHNLSLIIIFPPNANNN